MSDTDTDDDPFANMPEPEKPAPVGVARMRKDGTLVLQLRTVSDGGAIGEMTLVVPPDDDRYAAYVAHLAPIEPGRAKPIPPFPAREIDPDSV
jgi:D-lyxose ketol-isomerase